MNGIFLPTLLLIPISLNKCCLSDRIIDCNTIETCYNAVHIQVIPELELFQVICYLSGIYPGITSLDFKYKSDIKEYFGKHKNHPAVTITKNIIRHHYSHNLIKVYILNDRYREDVSHIDLLRIDGLDGLNDTREAKLQEIDSLRTACKQFADDVNFAEFFNARRPYFLKKINEVKDALDGLSIIEPREAFWGTKKDKYRIVIVLLENDLHSCCFENDGLCHSIFLLTPKFAIDGDAKFGNADSSNLSEGKMSARDYIYFGSGHEFGHSFLNPLTRDFKDRIDEISFDFQKSGQPTKVDFLNESVLRTYTAYEFVKQGRADIGNMVVQAERMNGYLYNDKILKLLQYYDANRGLFKKFEDFLPYLLSELSKRCATHTNKEMVGCAHPTYLSIEDDKTRAVL